MTTTEELLRQLALEDEAVIRAILAPRPGALTAAGLSHKAQAIARLSALVALNASVASYEYAVMEALAAGVTPDEIVGALLAVAPLVGLTRVTAAAPGIALAMGYDIGSEIEGHGGLGE